MKEYHFQKKDTEFDQTIRLDEINEEMKKREKDNLTDNLGDKDAFLDAFETEKFDHSIIDSTREGFTGDLDNTQQNLDNTLNTDEDEPFFDKKMIAIISVVAVVVMIVCFALARGRVPSDAIAGDLPKEQQAVLIQEVQDDGELIVYDVTQDKIKSINVTEETIISDAQGEIGIEAQFNEGDLVLVCLGEDGKAVEELNFGGEIEIDEVTGLTPNVDTNKLVGEEENEFEYGAKAMFIYNQEKISPEVLEPCDVLVLKSYEDIVWSVEVVEYHGYILVENKENIVNGSFQFDEEEPVSLKEVERISAKEGTHTITVSGDNIEKRTDSIFVKTGEEAVYDLSKAQEKVGVLIVNADETDYKLYINGNLVDSAEPSVLPLGEYDLVILKSGYAQWSRHVVLNSATMTVDANLQREVEFGSVVISANVESAQLYLNGEKMGYLPIELNLPYDNYKIEVVKNGYKSYLTTISVNTTSMQLKVDLERE